MRCLLGAAHARSPPPNIIPASWRHDEVMQRVMAKSCEIRWDAVMQVSALPPRADILRGAVHVRSVLKAAILIFD
jgi:hypothetical protein